MSLKRALYCGVASTLLFGGHFRAYLDPDVRYFRFFSHADLLPLVLAILTLALLFFAVASPLLRAGGNWEKAARAGFVIVLAQGLLVSVRPFAVADAVSRAYWHLATIVFWCEMGIVLVFGWKKPKYDLSNKLAKLTLILSPLPLVLVIQFLATPAVSSHAKAANPNVAPVMAQGAPIIIVVFDEWSFHRTFLTNGPPDYLPRLQEFCKTSTFYRQAYSPGSATLASIPRILFPTNASIFDRAPKGYRKALAGFYLPYQSMLSNRVDECLEFTYCSGGNSLLTKTAFQFVDFVYYWEEPWLESLRKAWYGSERWGKPIWLLGPYWYQLGRLTSEHAVTMLKEMPGDTIAFFHFPFPHAPFVYNADGSYRQHGFRVENPEGYRLSRVAFLDALGFEL